MNVLVDTSVWSLAMRRDMPAASPHVERLAKLLSGGATVFTTGVILQELLQGFAGPKARDRILASFAALPFLVPQKDDHVDAAELRNHCRRKGLQVSTIDALIGQLAIRNQIDLLSSDRDFEGMSRLSSLSVLKA